KGRLKEDDIVINKDGAWTGKVAYIKDLFCTEIAINEHLFIIRNNGNFVQKYLFYYLLSTPGQKQIKLSITGAAQPGINTKFINLLSIPKPPLKEQNKIADILSKVDDQIDLTEIIIFKTEELKKGLMQKLLTKGIGHHHLKDRRIGLKDYKLPDNWEVKKIEETSFLKGRIGWQGLTTKEYLNKGDFILVTGTDFKEGRINWDTCVYIEENRYQMDQNIQLKNEDILVTKDGTIGKIAYVDTIPKPATLNSGIFVLRPIDGAFYPKFFYYILKSFYFDYFMNILKAGSTISHLYQRDFVKFKFPFPSITEQKQIALILSKVDEQIQDNNKELNRLNELKKGLMQDLLTGKVRVTV
ncbi:MAG: restriction endonuclease subunit S, partial [Candidatus Thermoplasmatota archaeon]|nr:restriction endonuclease subunit S [Candidatus Thermoplasmatota archaeon]